MIKVDIKSDVLKETKDVTKLGIHGNSRRGIV